MMAYNVLPHSTAEEFPFPSLYMPLLGVSVHVGGTDQVLGDLCQVRYTTIFGLPL